MLFNSLKFLVFFPLVFMLYWALPHRARKYFLLAVSYYFYMCWKPEFIVLILYSTAVDYFCALGMERRAEQKKLFLAVSLTMNLGLLFFFKYFNFFGATLTALCRAVSIPFPRRCWTSFCRWASRSTRSRPSATPSMCTGGK